MSLKQVKGCKHLRCYDCGTVEDVGYWTVEEQGPVFVKETMKAAAKRHVKEEHAYRIAGEDEKSLDEHVAELCYVQQCIDWTVVE